MNVLDGAAGAALARVEGTAWALAQDAAVGDPWGFRAVRRAYRSLPAGSRLTPCDVMGEGGLIYGDPDFGRVYAVRTGGRLVLLAYTADEDACRLAISLGIDVED
jgi:hypothetical protein